MLIGQTVRKQLFRDEDPLHAIVRLRGQPYEVVGVLAGKGQTAEGRDQDDWVMLPHTTAQAKLRDRTVRWLDDIVCSAVSPELVYVAIDKTVALMRERHGIRADQDDDFNIRRPDELIKAQMEASRTMSLLLLSIAAVALVVGGIGVMNVMLASVAQRTREIGLRLAVGARPSYIQAQFLGEAILLCVLGGVLGFACSVAGSRAFEQALGWNVVVSPDAFALALLFAFVVGVLFGFYPARRASLLDPIEALRAD